MKTVSMFVRGLLLIMLGMGLVACDDDEGSSTPRAQVRVVHASPDAPAVDVLLNDGVVLSGVSYQGVSGDLTVAVDQANTFKINVANTDTTVIEQPVDLVEGSRYTLLAVNTVAAIEPLLLLDDTLAPADGFLKVKVLHASPTAGNVDIYVSAPGDDIATISPTLANVSFKAASDYLEVPAGDYRVRVTSTGSRSVVYDSGLVQLPAGKVYTLAAVDATQGSAPISLLGLTGEDANPSFILLDDRARVRAIHLSFDAGNVDVFANGTRAFEHLAFTNASPYATLASGSVSLTVNAAGDVNPYRSLNVDLDPSEDYTVLALNTFANLEVQPVLDDNSAPEAGHAKFRVVHASPDAPAVDILIDDAPLLSGVRFRDVSDYQQAPAGTYNVKVRPASGGTPVIDADVTLVAGDIYTIIAANELSRITALVVNDN